MNKKVPVLSVSQVNDDELRDLPPEVTIAVAEVASSIREAFSSASATGVAVLHRLMDAELTARIGAKQADKSAERKTLALFFLARVQMRAVWWATDKTPFTRVWAALLPAQFPRC